MSTEPTEPYPLPDTGSYPLVDVEGEESVIVPKSYFLRLRALELYADGETREMAEGAARLVGWDPVEVARTAVSAEEARRQLGLEP